MVFGKRPSQLLAVYIESRRIEVLRGRRHWRTWQLAPAEHYQVPEGEAFHDVLQRLNLRPRGNHSTALVLFLPRNHYHFTTEHYPLAIADRLEETLTFDWSENLFHDAEGMLHFAAPAVAGSDQLLVPIFSLSREVYEKFYQSLGAAHFHTFSVIPAGLMYSTLLATGAAPGTNGGSAFVARVLGPSRMEVNRLLAGRVVESFMVHDETQTLSLFRERLKALQGQAEDREVRVCLVSTPEDGSDDSVPMWVKEGLPITRHTLTGAMILPWVESLVTHDRVPAFGADVLLKPWQPPRALWPLLAVAALYLAFAAYELRQSRQLTRSLNEIQFQRKQLEAQWKPIEQLQNNISKLQEEQKALAEFDKQGYPVLELFNLLAQITPDDTWLDFLSLSSKELQLRGESKSAVRYLSELSKVEGFTNVSFASPVSRNPTSDKERFNVRLQLDAERLRKAIGTGETEPGTEDASTKGGEPLSDGMPLEAQPGSPEDRPASHEQGGSGVERPPAGVSSAPEAAEQPVEEEEELEIVDEEPEP
jgi:general secretion pathway protein L